MTTEETNSTHNQRTYIYVLYIDLEFGNYNNWMWFDQTFFERKKTSEWFYIFYVTKIDKCPTRGFSE